MLAIVLSYGLIWPDWPLFQFLDETHFIKSNSIITRLRTSVLLLSLGESFTPNIADNRCDQNLL